MTSDVDEPEELWGSCSREEGEAVEALAVSGRQQLIPRTLSFDNLATVVEGSKDRLSRK